MELDGEFMFFMFFIFHFSCVAAFGEFCFVSANFDVIPSSFDSATVVVADSVAVGLLSLRMEALREAGSAALCSERM